MNTQHRLFDFIYRRFDSEQCNLIAWTLCVLIALIAAGLVSYVLYQNILLFIEYMRFSTLRF